MHVKRNHFQWLPKRTEKNGARLPNAWRLSISMVPLGRVAAAGGVSRPYSQNTSKPKPRRVETPRERQRERERERERDRRRLRWLAGSGAVVVAGNVPVRARISTHFRKVTYCEKLTFLVQIYFYTFISLHIPLKWKLPNPDLNKTQPPTINGMKSAPPKTYASSSSVGSCCCNVVRVWLLPLLGHPGRAGRHDHSITTSRCDTWQMRAPQIQLETSTRGSQTAASKRAGATRPNTWSPPPAPTTPRRAAAHSDGGGAGPRCR